MQKLLITGVSGFIGQALVASLKDDYEIIGLYEHFDSRKKNPEIAFENKYVCDLRNTQMLEYIIGTEEPDFVIHLAARSEVANSFANYAEVGDINYGGTVALAEANRKFNPNMKLFVMASTMETYGKQVVWQPFTEETPQNPMAPYAVAKVASEKYLEYMSGAYSFPFTILRQTNAYGRTDNNFFVMERIISQWLDFSYGVADHVNLGDPRPYRNFLYISDLVRLYKKLLKHVELVAGATFVTGPNNCVSIKRLNYQVAKALGFSGVTADKFTKWNTIPERPGEIFYLNSDPAKVTKRLGWKPKVSLADGIQRTIEVLSEDAKYD